MNSVSLVLANEFIAVSLKEDILPMELIFEYADAFMEIFDFLVITKKGIFVLIFNCALANNLTSQLSLKDKYDLLRYAQYL